MSRPAYLAAILFVSACGNGQPGDACPIAEENYQCHRAIVEEHVIAGNACTVITVDDGQPCRTGVGICSGGHCLEPLDTPAACGGGAVPPGDVCGSGSDCYGYNLCVDYSCPFPWQDVCLSLPKPDGTRCDNGLACLHGSCCLPVQPESCSIGMTGNSCSAIEDCTVGECLTDGACHFTRSMPGDDCNTKAGDLGKCIQNEGDVVPRCAPTTPGK